MTATNHVEPPNDLADFVSIGRKSPVRVGIYGPNGVGKTSFIAAVPGIFIAPTEDGAEQLRVPQWKTRLRTLDKFNDVITMLRDKRHPYTAFGVDTASMLERLFMDAIEARLRKEAVKKDDPLTIADLNEEYGEGYAAVAREWHRMTDRFDELRDKRGMSIWVTCPSRVSKVKNLVGKDYDAYTLDLYSQKSTLVLTSWLDYVLFARQDVSLAETEKGKKVIANKGQLSVYTRGSAEFLAKTRGEIPWPDRLPLDFDTVMALHELIGTHGKDLGAWLTDRFGQAIGPLTEKSAESADKATKGFVAAIGKSLWHVAANVVEQMEAECAEESEEASE